MSAETILVLCKNCKAKNRVDPLITDKTIRCGKCGHPLVLEISEEITPTIEKLKKVATKVKLEFEDYTHYKVCSIAVDLVEDTIHLKWKVETNIDELWRLPQRWHVEYYFTIKMLLAIYKVAPEIQVLAASLFERYLNFAPEDEGENFRDLCLLSIKAERKRLAEMEKKFNIEDVLLITGPRRKSAMEEVEQFTRHAASVRQNYKGTLINKASLIYKAVKPYDLALEKEKPIEEIYKEETSITQEDKKLAVMKMIEQNIDKLSQLDAPYIRIFARKYGLGNEERRQNLKELLESKNVKLPEKVIYRLIQKELDEIEYERFERKIQAPEKLSLNHYVRRFLELYPDFQDYIPNFYRFLVGEQVIIEDVSMNVNRLRDIILKVRRSIVLEQFEKKLTEDIEGEKPAPISEEEIPISAINPASESYIFFRNTLLPGKSSDVSGVIRLYIDNFMDNNANRTMLRFFLKEQNMVADPENFDISAEIKKIQYEDIPESIDDEPESFDSYSSQEILTHFDKFDFNKRLRLMRYLFERMGFNSRIIDKEEGKSGIIFLDNQEDEKLIVKFFYPQMDLDHEDIKEITDLVNKYSSDYGIVISSSSFTPQAVQYSLENDIELIDRNKIKRLIGNVL